MVTIKKSENIVAGRRAKSPAIESKSALRAPVALELALLRKSPLARLLNLDHVQALAGSISIVGLMEPIIVRRVSEGPETEAYEVIAGIHRLEAVRALGRSAVPAMIVEADDLESELMLIDENLCRYNLTPAEKAAATVRRKWLRDRVHGSPKAKGAHAAHAAMGHKHDASAKLADAFTTETAEATGVTLPPTCPRS